MSVAKLLGVMGAALLPLSSQINAFLRFPGIAETLLLFTICGALAKVIEERSFRATHFTRNYFRVVTGMAGFSWAALFATGALVLTAGTGVVVFATIIVIYFGFGGLFSMLLNRELQRRLVADQIQPLPTQYAGVFGFPLGRIFSWIVRG